MTVPDGAALRCSARFSGPHQQDIVNVWTLQCNFAAPQAELDVFDAVDTYLTSVYVEFDDDVVTDCSVVDLKVDVVEFVGGKWVVTQNVGFGPWGSGLNFTEGAHELPEGCAAVGFLQTALGKHQGRKFLGGFSEDANSPTAAVDPGVQTRILAGLVKIITPHVISVGNEIYGVVLDHADGTIRNIIAVAINTFWGYMRSRTPGRGS